MDETIETRVARLETKVEQKCEQYDKDIDRLQDQTDAINRLATSVELLAKESTTTNEKLEKIDVNLNKKIDKVDEKVNKLDTDLNEVKNQDDKKDAKKWNILMKQVMIILVSVILGVALAKIGLQ